MPFLPLIGLWQQGSGLLAFGKGASEACAHLLGMGPLELSSIAGGSVKFCQ